MALVYVSETRDCNGVLGTTGFSANNPNPSKPPHMFQWLRPSSSNHVATSPGASSCCKLRNTASHAQLNSTAHPKSTTQIALLDPRRLLNILRMRWSVTYGALLLASVANAATSWTFGDGSVTIGSKGAQDVSQRSVSSSGELERDQTNRGVLEI